MKVQENISPVQSQVGGFNLDPKPPASFQDFMTDALSSVDQAQHKADHVLMEVATGREVDLHGMMISMEKADIALRTMVTARDKVVEAYQQVMNMSI